MQPHKLPLSLHQQYRPPTLSNAPIGPSASAATSSVEGLATASSNNTSQLLTFDRQIDAVCNLAPSAIGSANTPAVQNDITSVTWLPHVAAPSDAASATSSSSSSSTLSRKVAPDAWLLAIMPNGCVRAVCGTAPGAHAPCNEILPATPEADVAKNSAGHPMFQALANDIVSFVSPLGELAPVVVATAPAAAATSNSNKQPAASTAPVVRGRGHNKDHLHVATLTAASTATTTAAAAAPPSIPGQKTFASRASMMSAVFFRGGMLHTVLLDCPLVPITGATAATKTAATNPTMVLEHSLGKETALPEKLFRSIEAVTLKHFIIPPADAGAAAASPPAADRHILLVHVNGKSLFDGELVSAVACFELNRKGTESLTVAAGTAATAAAPFLTATLRTQWTVFADCSVGAAVSGNPNVQVLRFSRPKRDDEANSSSSSSSRREEAHSCQSAVASVAVIGHAYTTTTTTSSSNNSSDAAGGGGGESSSSSIISTTSCHVHLIFGFAGTPAVLRPALLHLPSGNATTTTTTPIKFLLPTSTSHHSQSVFLGINPKHAVHKIRVLPELREGTSLIAVSTTDNIVQVLCAVFRKRVVFDETSDVSSARRSRGGEDQQQQQQQQQGSSKWSLVPPKTSPQQQMQSGSWPLLTPRAAATSSASPATKQQQLQRLQQLQLTMLNSIVPVATTAKIDDISLVQCSVPTAPGAASSAPRYIPLLVVVMGVGIIQSFPLLGATEPKLLRTEMESVALPKSADWGSLQLSIPNVPVAMEGAVSKYCVAVLHGSWLVLLRPKRSK